MSFEGGSNPLFLEEGKVRLSVHGEVQSVLEKEAPMVMKPGQTAVVNTSSLAKVNDDKGLTAHSGWSRNDFF